MTWKITDIEESFFIDRENRLDDYVHEVINHLIEIGFTIDCNPISELRHPLAVSLVLRKGTVMISSAVPPCSIDLDYLMDLRTDGDDIYSMRPWPHRYWTDLSEPDSVYFITGGDDEVYDCSEGYKGPKSYPANCIVFQVPADPRSRWSYASTEQYNQAKKVWIENGVVIQDNNFKYITDVIEQLLKLQPGDKGKFAAGQIINQLITKLKSRQPDPKWTDRDIDNAYMCGLINSGNHQPDPESPFPSLDILKAETERLQKLGYSNFHEAIESLKTPAKDAK